MSENCWEKFFEDLYTLTLDKNAAELAAEDFVDHFDNPKPIIQEMGNTLEGFGERTIVFVFILIFLLITIILWTFVGYGKISWITALILNIIILVTIIVFVIIYRMMIRTYLEIQSEIILNSFKAWGTEGRKKVIPALNSAVCIYTENFKKK